MLLGFSQKTLAGKVGVSKSAISQWENDNASIEGARLISLSKAFNSSPEFLVSGKQPPTTASLSEEEMQLIDKWRIFNQKERHLVKELFDVLDRKHQNTPPPYKKPGAN